MNYLDSAEFEVYGLDSVTQESWVAAASSMINAHCRRPTLGVSQYLERLRLAYGSNTVQLTYLPLAAVDPAVTPIVLVRARYASAGHRNNGGFGLSEIAFDVAQSFGLPGSWSTLDASAVDSDKETGIATLPTNVLGLRFNEVEITYNAGVAVIPDPVKFACAQIVKNAQATPGFNVRAETMDRLRLEYFTDSMLDSNVRAMLAPFVAQRLG